jgi:hypothetical protein
MRAIAVLTITIQKPNIIIFFGIRRRDESIMKPLKQIHVGIVHPTIFPETGSGLGDKL